MTLDCTCNRLKEAEAKAAKWDAIVKCKDCKHYEESREACWHFSHLEMHMDFSWEPEPHWVERDGFCSWGERSES